MASDKIEVAVQVVKIEPGGKYALLFQHQLSNEQAARIKHDLQEFMVSDQTFVVIAGGDIRLVRVDDASEAPSEKV